MAYPSLEQSSVKTNWVEPATSGGSVEIDNIFGEGLWHNHDSFGIKVSGASENNHVTIDYDKIEMGIDDSTDYEKTLINKGNITVGQRDYVEIGAYPGGHARVEIVSDGDSHIYMKDTNSSYGWWSIDLFAGSSGSTLNFTYHQPS